MISMTTERGGCGYVYVSWTVPNNVPDDDMCGISHFNVTLSSVNVFMTMKPMTNSHNFTRLPYDTPFNVTVIGTNNEDSVIHSVSTSVRTTIIESTYVRVFIK